MATAITASYTAAQRSAPEAPRRRGFLTYVSRLVNVVRLAGKPQHRRRVRQSRRVLSTLRRFKGPHAAAQAFSYLRQVDPLVFEEVAMSALEDAGALVLRSRRYTGDGGVDGRCWFPWAGLRTIAVQVKRFDAAVTPNDVRDFCAVVIDRGYAGGIFVHCGRSGPKTYDALRGRPVQLVSGQRLLDCFVRSFV